LGVTVNTISETATAWWVDLRVYEGVYRKDHYPVRVVDVPAPPPDRSPEVLERQMAAYVLNQARLHMKSGSLPPKGMQLNGDEVWRTEVPELSASDATTAG
jgi:hypothetical protein